MSSSRVNPQRVCKVFVDMTGGAEITDLVANTLTEGGVKKGRKSGKRKSSEVKQAVAQTPVEPEDDKTMIADENDCSTLAPLEECKTPAVVVKRKRGRPRKNPEASSTLEKTLRFQDQTPSPGEGSLTQVPFPVTPYPGKTDSTRRIPRPPNAFMIFGKENRRRFSLENPNSTNKDISRLLGEKWKTLDEERKSEYKEAARKAVEEHRNKHPNYQYVPSESRKRKKNKLFPKPISQLTVTSSVGKGQNGEQERAKYDESNKENIPPSPSSSSLLPIHQTAQNQSQQSAPALKPPYEPIPPRVITELFIAPPGYENVEIMGLDKFVLWENKLIPYKEWLGAEGDVKRLSGNYTLVPEQLLQPIANCVIAGTNLESQMTLNDCNAVPSSESDKSSQEPEKSGSEADAQKLLHDLMSGDMNSGAGKAAAVIVQREPLGGSSASTSKQFFWSSPCETSDEED